MRGRRSGRGVVLVLSGCILLAGCQKGPNTGPLRPGMAELREVMRIGALDGPEEYRFQEISAFAVGPQGKIVVADLAGFVREYTPDGEFVRQLARPGAGPGEARYVLGIAISAEGAVALHDLQNARVSVYDSTGAFEWQVPRPAGRPRYSRDGILYDGSGALWMGITPARSELGKLPRRPIYGRVTREGQLTDTAYLPSKYWEACPTRSEPRFTHGYHEDIREPYVPKVKWYWGGGDMVLYGCPAAYSFEMVSADGEAVQGGREWTPPDLSREEAAYVREQHGVPPERPAYHRFWTTEDGRVWVWVASEGQRRAVSDELQARGAPETVWDYDSREVLDVFSSRGEWMGSVDIPDNWVADPFPGRRDPFFRGDTVWAVMEDELGVPYLARFLVEWGEEEAPL